MLMGNLQQLMLAGSAPGSRIVQGPSYQHRQDPYSKSCLGNQTIIQASDQYTSMRHVCKELPSRQAIGIWSSPQVIPAGFGYRLQPVWDSMK